MPEHDAVQMLRLPQVKDQSGHARSTLYGHIARGLWTRPVKLGPRSVAWPAHEVRALNTARMAGRSEADVRALVAQLEEARHPKGERP